MTLYSIHRASPNEKTEIIKIMLENKRQTMNLRLMPAATLLLLKNVDLKIIGWIGLDYQYNSEFPETFSLFVSPDYRKQQLGLFLKHACYSLLYLNGCTKSYSRMEASHNQNLIDYNVNTGFYRILKENDIKNSWRELCHQCELFKQTCLSQTYLEVNVVKLVEYFNGRLGIIQNNHFPKFIINKSTLQWSTHESGY